MQYIVHPVAPDCNEELKRGFHSLEFGSFTSKNFAQTSKALNEEEHQRLELAYDHRNNGIRNGFNRGHPCMACDLKMAS